MKTKYIRLLQWLLPIVSLLLVFYIGNYTLFMVVYFAMFVLCSIRVLQSVGRQSQKILVVIGFLTVMIFQMVLCTTYAAGHIDTGFAHPLRKLIATIIVPLPALVSRYILIGRYTHLYLPSIRETGTISFAALMDGKDRITSIVGSALRAGKHLTPGKLKKIYDDLSVNSSFKYVNNGMLTEEYFAAARKSLDDTSIYIVISNTGSAASDVISVFTQKAFNHASLSFDAQLETTVSYNGGARIYPPGLNSELMEFFFQKPNSSILIYRLPCKKTQKAKILQRIEEINRDGSAYNVLGMLINKSYKPNILYCSQFVYKMLEYAGIAYFEAGLDVIKPTDFIEKDYYRQLEFVREVKLWDTQNGNRNGSIV
ncbi:MAG: hypothetical protein LBU41_03040 [Clostridiales Family XIII bacterium]|jgi:hypothetical protein|nr:hypothetical protein [Clostridiales Family XIII bacterium]